LVSQQTAAELAAGMLDTVHSIQHVLHLLLQEEFPNTTSSSSGQQQQQQERLLSHMLWLPSLKLLAECVLCPQLT
jgi:hypothetical protein